MKSNLRLRFSARARRELRAILQYSLMTWGAAQRDAYAAAIDEALVRLTLYPELGRERAEFGAGSEVSRWNSMSSPIELVVPP